MMDSCQKEGQSLSPCSASASASGMKYCCSNCKTTKTPMWRTGPSGPKSLCNACGIRFRKKRPVAAAAAKNDVQKVKIEKRRNMMEKGGMVMLKKKKKKKEGRQRQWNEVERAALLLMALSCGAVFA